MLVSSLWAACRVYSWNISHIPIDFFQRLGRLFLTPRKEWPCRGKRYLHCYDFSQEDEMGMTEFAQIAQAISIILACWAAISGIDA